MLAPKLHAVNISMTAPDPACVESASEHHSHFSFQSVTAAMATHAAPPHPLLSADDMSHCLCCSGIQARQGRQRQALRSARARLGRQQKASSRHPAGFPTSSHAGRAVFASKQYVHYSAAAQRVAQVAICTAVVEH